MILKKLEGLKWAQKPPNRHGLGFALFSKVDLLTWFDKIFKTVKVKYLKLIRFYKQTKFKVDKFSLSFRFLKTMLTLIHAWYLIFLRANKLHLYWDTNLLGYLQKTLLTSIYCKFSHWITDTTWYILHEHLFRENVANKCTITKIVDQSFLKR